MNAREALPVGMLKAGRQLAALSDSALLALAFACAATLADTAGLAVSLRMSPAELVRTRRAPTTLSLERRLLLASVAGRHDRAALVARELRRRTHAAIARAEKRDLVNNST